MTAENEALYEIWKNCDSNKSAVLMSKECRCFYCLKFCKPAEILEWVDEEQTACCPNCGIDSIIGSSSGVDLNNDKLFNELQAYYF